MSEVLAKIIAGVFGFVVFLVLLPKLVGALAALSASFMNLSTGDPTIDTLAPVLGLLLPAAILVAILIAAVVWFLES